MNLHGIVSGAIGIVNPNVQLLVEVSTGETDDDTGNRTPTYAPPVVVMGQVQSMAWRDLQLVDGLNLQGTRYVIYLFGRVEGIVRPDNKGGDLVTDPYGRIYLVAQVLEQWGEDSWCKIAATRQNE